MSRRNKLTIVVGGGGGAFATINAPTTADEGDDPVITATSSDAGLTLTLRDRAGVDIQTGITTPYSTTYPDITPGTRVVQWVDESNNAACPSVDIVVAPQEPSLDAPLDEAVYDIGDTITFEATGTADGFDANTTKVEFYVDGVLRATANSDTAGVWTAGWDTSGASPGTDLPVVARRYWEGLAGETGTIDSTASVDIDLEDAATPATIMGANCTAWWRADLGVTVSTGVSAWADQVGSADFAQGTGANQPTFNATGGPNSTPSMTFDGSNDSLAATLARAAPGTTPAVVWFIFRQLTWSANDPFMNDASGTMVVRQTGSTPTISMFCGGTNRNASAALALNTWGRGQADFLNSAADTLRLVSTDTNDAASAGNTAGTAPLLGRNGASSVFGNFELCEVAFFDAVPNGSQDTALDAYVTTRYGSGLV